MPSERPSGSSDFFVGAVLALVGGYLLLLQVEDHGGYWYVDALGSPGRTFAIPLLLMMVGIIILFFRRRQPAGAVLLSAGVLAILSGILVHFGDHLEHTSWWQMVSKLLMVLAGAGMIGRATRPASTDKVEPPRPTGN